jgi:hypothetical protein
VVDVDADVVSLREVLIVVLVELSSCNVAVVSTAAVVNSATFAVVVVAACWLSVATFASGFTVFAPAFGTAVHLFPLMLVMKAPLARDAMLSDSCPKVLLLKFLLF